MRTCICCWRGRKCSRDSRGNGLFGEWENEGVDGGCTFISSFSVFFFTLFFKLLGCTDDVGLLGFFPWVYNEENV